MLHNGVEAAKQAIALQSTLAELGHPKDIFKPDSEAAPTARLAENFDFSALGYGRYLGQV